MDVVNCPDCGLAQPLDSNLCIGCGKPVNTPITPVDKDEEELPRLKFPNENNEEPPE